nr:histone deacetylase 14 [Tanacetum cinerariifolium]
MAADVDDPDECILPLPSLAKEKNMASYNIKTLDPHTSLRRYTKRRIYAAYSRCLKHFICCITRSGGYYTLSSNVKQLASDVCGGRCIFLGRKIFLNALVNLVVESFCAFVGEQSIAPDYNYNFFLDDEPSVKEVYVPSDVDDPDECILPLPSLAKEKNMASYNIKTLDPHTSLRRSSLYNPHIRSGNGEGTTLYLPLLDLSGNIAMQSVFIEVIVAAAQRFMPYIILISAGYDGHVRDPIGNIPMTTGGYYTLSSNVKQLASDVCGGRCIFLGRKIFLNALVNLVVESFCAFVGEQSIAPDYNYNFFLDDEPSVKEVYVPCNCNIH